MGTKRYLNKEVVYFFIFFMSVLLFFTNQIYAQGNIRVGNTEVHPYVIFDGRYDDNIYLTPDNKKDDWITTVTPGVDLRRTAGRHIFELGCSAELLKYWDNPDDSTQHYNLSLLGDLNFPGGKFFTIRDKFKKTTDPATSEITDPEDRTRNDLSFVAGHKGERISFDMGYENIRDDYKELDTLDKYEDIYTITGYYLFLPKTSFLLEYNRGFVTYDEERNDADYHEANIGIKGQWSPKMTGLFKIGQQRREYAGGDDFRGSVTFLGAQWTPLERTSLNITGRWGVDESTSDVNNYYRTSSLGLKLVQGIGEKWSLSLSGSHKFNKYPEEQTTTTNTGKRRDSLWTAGIAGTYSIRKWLSLKIGYQYKNRESNFNEFDYDGNQYFVAVSATF